MTTFCIVTDQKRCISCKACEAHCKAKNAVPTGLRLGHIISEGPLLIDGKCHLHTEYTTCYHCEKPWCMDICPSGAIHKRESDGTVWIDDSTCIACNLCVRACPWNMLQFNKENRTMLKCDHCIDRIDDGLKPACVTACTTHALSYVPLDEAPEAFRANYAKRMQEGAALSDAFVAKQKARQVRKVSF